MSPELIAFGIVTILAIVVLPILAHFFPYDD